MNITEKEIQLLKQAKSEEEWDATCSKIKKIHNGSYPDDWYNIVILGKIATFKSYSAEIKITTIKCPDNDNY